MVENTKRSNETEHVDFALIENKELITKSLSGPIIPLIPESLVSDGESQVDQLPRGASDKTQIPLGE